MRRQQQSSQTSQTQLHIDQSDDENTTSSPSQILERVQSDRVTVTKPEEDRRRRTIIVEKKNGTFGFTLQSYGIHYKKEQEIEMITYVDYVDYDGPAYRAGMREGDVILSINGTDMEKADHKTLVGYIKNCDTRMRMVVLFEDCVRKVELHMRYIQLQRILQNKMTELEKLCLRERQLLEGKWKTHSLPARKKNQNKSENVEETSASQTPSYSYCRPTVSTEDVAGTAKTVVPPPQAQPTLILAYQYLDPRYRYMLQPSTSSSGEYLLTFEQPASKYEGDRHHFIVKTPCETKGSSKNHHNGTSSSNTKQKKSSDHSYAGHLCNPCLQPNTNPGDNTSLEAYDLASPCCDPHCVPSARRRSRHKKRDSKSEETQTDLPTRARPHSTSSQTQTLSQSHTKSLPKSQSQGQRDNQSQSSQTQLISGPRRYFQLGAGLVSQCSLHSCTSSEISGMAPTTTGETTSYTTSLSTDTLYWDGSELNSTKSISKVGKPAHAYIPPEPIYVQYPVKPKSWDNLATKAFGGYGFGYGYMDGNPKAGTHKKKIQYVRAHSTNSADKHICQGGNSQVLYATIAPSPAGSQRRYVQTKSTESLLSVPGTPGTGSSCECVDASPNHETAEGRFFQSPRQSVVSPSDPNFGYYSARRTQTYPRNVVSTSSEATRL